MKIKFGTYMLRNWQKEDALSIASHANNRKIWANLRDAFPHPYGIVDAEAFLSMVFQQKPRTVFAISHNHEAIGSIGLRIGEDVHRFTAELGYWLAEPFWNNGIMTQAVEKFSEFAFSHFKLNRIYAEPFAFNQASAGVLEKAGFACEGILRANVFKDGKILDQLLYARVKDGLT
jgi:RimJ/RimL family protein N-acetyltransferase